MVLFVSLIFGFSYTVILFCVVCLSWVSSGDKIFFLYLSLILSESKDYVKNALMSGFFMGLGAFATYACVATLIHFAKKYILNFSLTFNDFLFTIASIMLMVAGLSEV